MNNKIIAHLVGWLLLAAILGFYLYGVGHAIVQSWDRVVAEGNYSPVLEGIIASMQALLLTNLGMLLGVSVANPQSAVAQQLILSRTGGQQAQALQIPDPLSLREKIQLFGLVLYVISLLACVVAWMRNDFTSESKEIVPLVAASGKMFFGVALAYLTLVFSKTP